MFGVDESGKGRIERAGMTNWIRQFELGHKTDEQSRGRVDVSKCDEMCEDVIKNMESRYQTSRNDWWDT